MEVMALMELMQAMTMAKKDGKDGHDSEMRRVRLWLGGVGFSAKEEVQPALRWWFPF